MGLPNFLIIGAQKSGTSWFAKMLSQHPEIFVCGHEIHFFDKAHNYQKGLDWYNAFFPSNGNYKYLGEKTPDYLWANGLGAEGHLPDVHRNVHKHLPDAKLIIILRNPVERAISALNHIFRTGRVSPLNDVNRILVEDKSDLINGHGVIEKGFYFEQISAYLELFHQRQVLILIYEEDVVGNPGRGLQKACEFLGARAGWTFTGFDRRINDHNQSQMRMIVDYYCPWLRRHTKGLDFIFKRRKIRPGRKTMERLYEVYRRPNQQLYKFLGRDIDSWKYGVHEARQGTRAR